MKHKTSFLQRSILESVTGCMDMALTVTMNDAWSKMLHCTGSLTINGNNHRLYNIEQTILSTATYTNAYKNLGSKKY